MHLLVESLAETAVLVALLAESSRDADSEQQSHPVVALVARHRWPVGRRQLPRLQHARRAAGQVGPVAMVLSVTFGLVAAAAMVRAPFRRVIIDGTDITRVRLLSRQTLHVRDVVGLAGGNAPASLLWSTSVPVIVLDKGTEATLTELAGYDALGRRNRRVQSACEALSAATSGQGTTDPGSTGRPERPGGN